MADYRWLGVVVLPVGKGESMSLLWNGNLKDFAEDERRERLYYEQENHCQFAWFALSCVLSATALGLGLYFYPILTIVLSVAGVAGMLYFVGREFHE